MKENIVGFLHNGFFLQIYPKSFFPNLFFFAPSKRRLQSLYLTVLRLLWLQYDMIKEFPWHQEAKFAMHIICNILKFTQEYCISHKAWNSFCGILKFTKKYCISHEKWKQRECENLWQERELFSKYSKLRRQIYLRKLKEKENAKDDFSWYFPWISIENHQKNICTNSRNPKESKKILKESQRMQKGVAGSIILGL